MNKQTFKTLNKSVEKAFDSVKLTTKSVTAKAVRELHSASIATSSAIAHNLHRSMGKLAVESNLKLNDDALIINALDTDSGKETEIGYRKACGCIVAHMLRISKHSHHLKTATFIGNWLVYGKTPKESNAISKLFNPIWNRYVHGQGSLRDGRNASDLILEIVDVFQENLPSDYVFNRAIISKKYDGNVKVFDVPMSKFVEEGIEIAEKRLSKSIADEQAKDKISASRDAKKKSREADKKAEAAKTEKLESENSVLQKNSEMNTEKIERLAIVNEFLLILAKSDSHELLAEYVKHVIGGDKSNEKWLREQLGENRFGFYVLGETERPASEIYPETEVVQQAISNLAGRW